MMAEGERTGLMVGGWVGGLARMWLAGMWGECGGGGGMGLGRRGEDVITYWEGEGRAWVLARWGRCELARVGGEWGEVGWIPFG